MTKETFYYIFSYQRVAVVFNESVLGGAMALTKNDIVKKVHELGFTKKRSVELIESLLEIIKSNLGKGEDVLISGFGKFCV